MLESVLDEIGKQDFQQGGLGRQPEVVGYLNRDRAVVLVPGGLYDLGGEVGQHNGSGAHLRPPLRRGSGPSPESTRRPTDCSMVAA